MRDDQKAKIAEDVSALTVHGLSRVASSKTKLGKFLWLIICLTSLGWAVFVGHQLVSRYLSRKVYLHQATITNEEMVFPAMTFCNTNYLGDSLDQKPLPKSCIKRTKHRNFTKKTDELHFNKTCDMFMARSELHSCKVNGLSCRFPSHFSPQRNLFPCYTLNQDKAIKQAVVAGSNVGLKMLLFYNESDITDRTPVVNSSVIDEIKDGLYLVIHDQDFFTKGLITEGIPLSPGHHISISLKKIKETRKPSPFHSGCVENGKEKYQKVFPGNHNVKLCLTSCIFLQYYKKCGVVHAWASFLMNEAKYPAKRNLSKAERIKCFLDLYKGFDFKHCNCSIPCNRVLYDFKVFSKPWPPKWYASQKAEMFAKVLNKTPSEINIKDIQENFLKVSIYFEEFATHVREEQEAYGWDNLVSDLGGQMGLFLGMSIISLVEMMLLLFDIIKAAVIAKKKNEQDTAM